MSEKIEIEKLYKSSIITLIIGIIVICSSSFGLYHGFNMLKTEPVKFFVIMNCIHSIIIIYWIQEIIITIKLLKYNKLLLKEIKKILNKEEENYEKTENE